MQDRTPRERRQFNFAMWEMTRLYSFMHCEVIVDPVIDPPEDFPGSLTPDGSQWKAVGTLPPSNGRLLGELPYTKTIDPRFMTADFTDDELASFGSAAVRVDHYIKAGDTYFRPSRGVWGLINWTLYPDRGCALAQVASGRVWESEAEASLIANALLSASPLGGAAPSSRAPARTSASSTSTTLQCRRCFRVASGPTRSTNTP